MRIKIIVKPNAKREAIEKTADGDYRVFVKAPAREGRANEAVIKVLAAHFKVPRSSIEILTGLSSKAKWVEIG